MKPSQWLEHRVLQGEWIVELRRGIIKVPAEEFVLCCVNNEGVDEGCLSCNH